MTDRQNSYDLLRIIATFSVILIHVNFYYFENKYEVYDGSAIWIIESLNNIITRFSVPCFVMLSGAFNLDRNENNDAGNFYKKSSFKLFLPTVCVMMILIVFQICVNVVSGKSLFSVLKAVFFGNFYGLWYMYMLVGIYILTPMILTIKRTLSFQVYKIVTFLMMGWAVLSQAFTQETLAYSMGVVFAYVPYYMMGDVIRQWTLKPQIRNNKKLISFLLLLVSIVCVILSFAVRFCGYNYYISDAYINFFSPTIVVYSCCVFSLFGLIEVKQGYEKMSSITFYVYLFHSVILKIMHKFISLMDLHEILLIGILLLCTAFVSMLVGFMYKNIWDKLVVQFDLKTRWYSLRIWDVFLP